MSKTYKPKRFTDIGLLKRLDFSLLIRLLEQHKAFFDRQEGFVWTHDPAEFSFDVLAKIMLNLDTAAPKGLMETLYYIEELSNEDYYELLLQIALDQDIRLPADNDPTVDDLLLLLCLECPEELEKFHTKIDCADTQKRSKRFQSYSVSGEIHPMFEPTDDVIYGMQEELDQWAEDHRQGLGMRVYVSREKDAIWFLLRRGQTMKRENAVTERGESEQVFFRPEKFDVAIYYPSVGELAIKVQTKGLRIAYMQAIGRHLFGEPGYFHIHDCEKYTLQPLIDLGRESLTCLWNDHGLKKMTLRELQIDHKDGEKTLETWKSLDVFTSMQKKKRQLANDKEISIRRAKLKVLRADNREHTLVIVPPNIALYDRDSDHDIIHPWLVKHGFIVNSFNKEMSHVRSDESGELLEAS